MITFDAPDGASFEVERIADSDDVLVSVVTDDSGWPDIGVIRMPLAELERVVREVRES